MIKAVGSELSKLTSLAPVKLVEQSDSYRTQEVIGQFEVSGLPNSVSREIDSEWSAPPAR